MVSKLGSQRINNIFTHLRKICQHPLLVRHHFTDKKVRAGCNRCGLLLLLLLLLPVASICSMTGRDIWVGDSWHGQAP
jgi:hypothetical protein